MINTITGKEIETAAALLRMDEVVAIPTETVYGLAGNALHESAIVKIYEAKKRPRFNPLITHVADLKAIERFAILDDTSILLANAFMPGPFTLLLPKKNNIPDMVTAGSDKVAIRIPDHTITRELLYLLDFPLAAPSANPFGYVSPTTASHVKEGLNGIIPYILDGGPCRVGLESTIAEVVDDRIILHRAGGITAQMMEKLTGMPVLSRLASNEHSPAAPGQLKSHYATHIPLYKGNVGERIPLFEGKRMAVISFQQSYSLPEGSYGFVLSSSGDLAEAARKLFATMRMLDTMEIDLILAEDFPDTGIGMAINDRLERAQAVFK